MPKHYNENIVLYENVATTTITTATATASTAAAAAAAATMAKIWKRFQWKLMGNAENFGVLAAHAQKC